MLKHFLYSLEFIILASILFISGQLLSLPSRPESEEIQLLRLQEKYNQQVKNDLENTLESLVGPGNVKAFVQIYLKKSQITTQSNKGTRYNKSTQTNKTQAVIVDQQHIALLINNLSPVKMDTYKNFTESALGINKDFGDTLSIEILPFYQHPFFTFGLSRLTLIRLAACMAGLFFVLLLLLIFIYLKERNSLPENEFFTGE